MSYADIAARLVEAGDAERVALLAENSALADAELAYALKDICYEAWHTDPALAIRASRAIKTLSEFTEDEEVAAVAAWVAGIASLIEGRMERAIENLDDAAARFLALDKSHAAASTQVSKLYALAMLGRYDEAVECGLRAREQFLAHNDLAAAGRIEHNVGNIYLRRDRYGQAETFFQAARERFLALDDQQQLAKIDNSLAYIHTRQHKFRSAELLYDLALKRAEGSKLFVTQAEIESSMGDLALFQGRYDRALDFLERARRKYAELGMPHQSAISEREIAEAYLELNLAPEAAAMSEHAAVTFAELGMASEQARALEHEGRALATLGQMEKAHARLSQARKLYADEENAIGVATVSLADAELHYDEGNFHEAYNLAAEAEEPFHDAGTWRRLLMARWLRAEAARAMGRDDEARTLLKATLSDAEEQVQPQVAQRCHTSLGLLSLKFGDEQEAEREFLRAIEVIESLRAPLPAEEFRAAFFTDKLAPYDEMVRLCLNNAEGGRAAEALEYTERARSRALVDMLGGTLQFRARARDEFEARLLAQLEELRMELNYLYSQINRSGSAAEMRELHYEVREREQKSLEITRQVQHRAGVIPGQEAPPDLRALQRELGESRALVEYTSLGEELLAFVVTDESVEVVRHLGSEREAEAALRQFHFQINSLRFGAQAMRRHMKNLEERARHHLESLYDLLLAPLEEMIGERQLVVVPHRALHYVPFHALHDGERYVIERREVSYAPSATVLSLCLNREERAWRRAVLLGVADEATPRVRDEVEALAPLFPESIKLLDEAATLESLREHATEADVLHLACHGQFRPDNPLFSSLRLHDGWLTVRGSYDLELSAGLVALSACETGVSSIAPGDEIIGLARGFFSAGAPSLLLSLWVVDDEATAKLMSEFYGQLLEGRSRASSLRAAQLKVMETEPHPFFWSPFVLLGRW